MLTHGTVHLFTPIVDDPYEFGAIAASNSLSDVYAMGGRPLFALNVVVFPSNRLPVSVLEKILLGAQDKAREAGICIVGGHTVDDTEPKFGLAVTGIVVPGGSRDNFEFTRSSLTYPESLSEIRRVVLNDAQTSGGLLIAVAAERCASLLQALEEKQVETRALVGSIIEGSGIRVL